MKNNILENKNYLTLNDYCTLISRGYNCPKNNIETDMNKGTKILMIGFKDISEKTIENEKLLNLKDTKVANKYQVSYYDIVLPVIIDTNIKIKSMFRPLYNILQVQKGHIKHLVYSQNAVILRLSNSIFKTEQDIIAFENFLNMETMQKKLATEVYSNEKTKTIMIDKLRNFKLPFFTEELKETLNKYEEQENVIKQIKSNINNLIDSMYNKI